MIELGKYNKLRAMRATLNGVYLADAENNEVLLPKKYIPAELRMKEEITVFIYRDSEDRITATTLKPKIQLGEFACLQVNDIAPFGAFLDWGLEKDLLVPFREQPETLIKGNWYVVYLFHDKQSDRLVASARINRFLEKENILLEKGEKVNLFVTDISEQGVNVIVNNRYRGLIFKNDLFQNLVKGDKIKGYIKNIRSDKKIDVVLQKPGYESIEPTAQKILDKLKHNKGFLELSDSSDPEIIKAMLGISKKAFKKAIGSLYKKKLIEIQGKGIKLLQTTE